jgi:hypothetical protein
MGAPVTVKNATDTWVNSAKPSKNYGEGSRLQLKTGAKSVLLYFNRPWTPGSTIMSAKLRVYNVAAWAGSVTLTVQRAGSAWSVNKANWNNKPAGSGPTATKNLTGAAAGTMWEMDVAPILQPIANGLAWYGLVLTTNNAADSAIHSAQSSSGALRPVLIVQWNDPPDAPDNLRPAGGRNAGKASPYVQYDFNDANGDTDLQSHQIQFGASTALLDAGTTTLDLGEVATTVPEADLSDAVKYPTWVALVSGTQKAWRVRTKDSAGIWSVYSDSQLFGYLSKGVLTITSPAVAPNNFIWEGSPDVSWTFTGRTQRAYQVIIADAADPNTWLWDSGKITSTATSQTIPFRVIKDAGKSYIITVRIWDDQVREALPSDPVYVEGTITATVAYDNTVTAVTALAAVSDAYLPVEHLTWTSAVAPDSFQLQRSSDGGATWEYRREFLPTDATLGGTSYGYDDNGATPYQAYQWRVMRIVAGKQSGNNLVVSGQVRKLAPFLMRKDSTDAVCFLNPKRNKGKMDIQELILTQAGPPVLQTQRLGGEAGHIEGRFTDNDAMAGVTADMQAARFERLRKDSGIEVTVYYANQTFNAIAYNFQIDTITDTSGVSYLASFDWFEVPA